MYRAHANVLGIQVDRVEVEARGYLDVRGFLGDDSVPAGFERVAFTTRVVSSEPAERIETLRQTVERHCPVLDILQRPIEVSGTLRHESPAAGRDAA